MFPRGSRKRPTRSPQARSVSWVTGVAPAAARPSGVAVLDIQPQQARGGDREQRVEHHDDRVADPRLGVPDRPALHLDSGQLLGVKGVLDERQQTPGVLGDDPGHDGSIAFGDRRLGHRRILPGHGWGRDPTRPG